MANLVKMVSSQGMWYEELLPQKAQALVEAFGSNFEVSVDQVIDVLGQTDLPFGTTVEPDDLKPEDRIMGTFYL